MLRLLIPVILILSQLTLIGCSPAQIPRPDEVSLSFGQGFITLDNGQELFERRWLTTDEAQAVVVMLHGSGSHSGTLSHLGNFLAEQSFHVYAFDYPGFGYSPGARTISPPFPRLQHDLLSYLDVVRNRHENLPIFLVGESMGGTLAIYSDIYGRLPVNGVILCGAAFDYPPDTNAFLRGIARFIGFFSDNFPLPVDLDDLTRSEQSKNRFLADPLVDTDSIPVAHANVLMGVIGKMHSELDKVKVPFYIQHGSDDRVAPLSGVEDLYRLATSSDKQMTIYPGLRHALLHEPEWLQVAEDMTAWITYRANGSWQNRLSTK
jgi:alpha-beta hydrolase superfamily lysophospholipase